MSGRSSSRQRIRRPDWRGTRSAGRTGAALLHALLAGACFVIGTSVASSQQDVAASASEAVGREIRELFAKCQKAVVKVSAIDAHGRLCGSGFFVDPIGTLYTSYGVAGESRDIVVSHGDLKYPARRIVADSRSGIAILKIDAETPFLTVGKSGGLEIASPVLAIGFPMDLPLTPSFGAIAGFDMKFLGGYFATRHIRANLPVQRGEGGAPLLNMRGEVVGILIASIDQGNASFAVTIEAAEKIKRDFMRFGKVQPGWLGIEIGELTAPIAGSTAQVKDILDDAPAATCGLKSGDVLIEIAGRKISSPEDVLDASFFITAQEELAMTVLREGLQVELRVQPVEHPAVRQDSFIAPAFPVSDGTAAALRIE